MLPGSTDIYLKADGPNPPDFTGMLKLARIVRTGSLSVVYHCLDTQNIEVAVKVITFPPGLDTTEKNELIRRVRRELGIWKRLDHPNIVPLLGTASDKHFGSNYPCMVSAWMTNETLFEYVGQHATMLSILDRVNLIKGAVAGLEYLHSHGIVHGDFHPGNILIDGDHNARLTDFGLSQALCPIHEQLSYLHTESVRPAAVLWAAPELLYPELYLKLKFEVTFQSDIYSLGSDILFVLSGKPPWKNRVEARKELKEFQNPPRPVWPVNMPDGVWHFIGRCWSPRDPESRPCAHDALIFSTDRLDRLLRPDPASETNVVLFGAVGSGKSSIVNLLSEKEVAEISSGADPCTKRPRSYQVSIDETRFRLWDTMGFGGPTSHLLPYEHAHALLRSIPEGVGLILLCTHKGAISPSLGRLSWLISNLFYSGRVPIALIVTHCDEPDEGWWERNQYDITKRTSIPAQFIPHACITAVGTGRDQSKHALKDLLRTHATSAAPTHLHLDLSYYATPSSDLTSHCKLSSSDVRALAKKFSRPLHPFNVVFLGDAGAGMSSIINLIAGHSVAETIPGITYTRSYRINTGTRQCRIWDTMDVNQEQNAYTQVLEKIHQLTYDLPGGSGVDFLVFCMRFGELTQERRDSYGPFEEAVCKHQFPIAVIVTQFESQGPTMDQWWETGGRDLVRWAIGGDVIGYRCIPPLASPDPDCIELNSKRVESRLSIEAMLEECISSRGAKRPLLGRRTRTEKTLASVLPNVLTRRCASRQR